MNEGKREDRIRRGRGKEEKGRMIEVRMEGNKELNNLNETAEREDGLGRETKRRERRERGKDRILVSCSISFRNINIETERERY